VGKPTIAELAREHETSRQTVRKRLEELGVSDLKNLTEADAEALGKSLADAPPTRGRPRKAAADGDLRRAGPHRIPMAEASVDVKALATTVEKLRQQVAALRSAVVVELQQGAAVEAVVRHVGGPWWAKVGVNGEISIVPGPEDATA